MLITEYALVKTLTKSKKMTFESKNITLNVLIFRCPSVLKVKIQRLRSKGTRPCLSHKCLCIAGSVH